MLIAKFESILDACCLYVSYNQLKPYLLQHIYHCNDKNFYYCDNYYSDNNCIDNKIHYYCSNNLWR